jgi:hypothetical protein
MEGLELVSDRALDWYPQGPGFNPQYHKISKIRKLFEKM